MRKSLKIFLNKENKYNELAEANKIAISNYNKKTLSSLLLIGWSLSLLPLASAIFNERLRSAIPAYLLTFAAFFILFLLFLNPDIKKYAIVGLYTSATIFILFGIYLSIIHSPNMQATILLGGFAILPLCIIDRPIRLNLFLVFWLVVHTILAFQFKPNNALTDLLNSLCAVVLGCYLGNTMMKARLEGFESSRLLTIEKETDMLTGLSNRRKLSETLKVLKTSNSKKPTGILMIDIDHFKEFNDKYGHAGGDMCLNHLGSIFTEFKEKSRFDFYRYGGEEFLVIAYEYGEKELISVAESLRILVENTNLQQHNITISIGVAYCGDEQVQNYENIINKADKAAYLAKSRGRNKVCAYSNEI